jgi:hypothetical protein
MSVPAKLKRAEDHSYGCVLVLDDGRNIRLDVCYNDIDQYLTEIGFPSLEAVAQSGKSDVYSLPIRMASTEWQTISHILTNSEHVKSTLADFPVLSTRMQLTFDVIETLAHRLYGGVGEPVPGIAPTFYLSHPIDFTASDDRDDSWRYALLSHRSGHLFKTYVNIETNAVEIEHDVIDNHFLERRLDVGLHCDGSAR